MNIINIIYYQSITGYLYVNYQAEDSKISALSKANLSFKPSSNRSALTRHQLSVYADSKAQLSENKHNILI